MFGRKLHSTHTDPSGQDETLKRTTGFPLSLQLVTSLHLQNNKTPIIRKVKSLLIKLHSDKPASLITVCLKSSSSELRQWKRVTFHMKSYQMGCRRALAGGGWGCSWQWSEGKEEREKPCSAESHSPTKHRSADSHESVGHVEKGRDGRGGERWQWHTDISTHISDTGRPYI